MRTHIDVYGPDQLKVLQQIFDSVWFQLKQDPSFVHAHGDKLREQLSRRVIESVNGDILDIDAIKRSVLASFTHTA
jgi:hypothetical protein